MDTYSTRRDGECACDDGEASPRRPRRPRRRRPRRRRPRRRPRRRRRFHLFFFFFFFMVVVESLCFLSGIRRNSFFLFSFMYYQLTSDI